MVVGYQGTHQMIFQLQPSADFFLARQLFQRLSDSMLALGLDFGGAECFLTLGSPLPCKDIEF